MNFVKRFYNENCLAEIFRVGLAHLALMGKLPLIKTIFPFFQNKIYLIFLMIIGGSMCACHAAGPGSIPGRDKFPG